MSFDSFVFGQILVAFFIGLVSPVIYFWKVVLPQESVRAARIRELEDQLRVSQTAADELFFSSLRVEQLVYSSTEGFFCKDHYVNFEERLFYKNFPLTERQQRKYLLAQNVDTTSIVPLVQSISSAASELSGLGVPIKFSTRLVRGVSARK